MPTSIFPNDRNGIVFIDLLNTLKKEIDIRILITCHHVANRFRIQLDLLLFPLLQFRHQAICKIQGESRHNHAHREKGDFQPRIAIVKG